MKKIISVSNPSSTRRVFLKKAAYHAPSLIIMGALTKPMSSVAGGTNSNPSGPPNTRPRRP